MSYSDKTGVKGCWSKGALTSNVMRWLPCLLRDLPADNDGALEKCFDAATKKNSLFGYLFNSPLFLNRDESLYIAHLGFSFLKSCPELARYCFDAKRGWLYLLFPKLHSLHLIMIIKLHADAKSCGMSMSPLATTCQQDEDCVGRLDRVSRRVSPHLTMLRTLQRYLIGAYDVWTKAGLIHPRVMFRLQTVAWKMTCFPAIAFLGWGFHMFPLKLWFSKKNVVFLRNTVIREIWSKL